eukprot:UC4_evm3s473
MSVCTFYLQGRCNRGDSCRFIHPIEKKNATSTINPLAFKAPLTPPKVCTFWLQGRCNRGADCRFLHEPEIPKNCVKIPEQDGYESPETQKIFSIDVECVATGPGHSDRAVAQIALVDWNENTVLNVYVSQDTDVKVKSYLTALTGITAELLETKGIPLSDALALLKESLPKDAIIVGQNISCDISWCKLVEGVDFESLRDLTGLWRCYNEKFRSWSYFSLEHTTNCLLDQHDGTHHNAATDAKNSIRLFKLHNRLSANGGLESAKLRLLNTPAPKSFSSLHPTFEGVCMGFVELSKAITIK